MIPHRIDIPMDINARRHINYWGMRCVAWLLVVFGLLTAVASPIVAARMSAVLLDQYLETERKRAVVRQDIHALYSMIDMLQAGRVPGMTVVPAWPGVLVGLGTFGLGVLILAIRRPRRKDRGADARYPCPYCAEEIKVAAVLCPHCRSDLTAPDALRKSLLSREDEADNR